jgi:hypothetical protein
MTFTGDRTIHIAASMFQNTVSLKAKRHMKPTFAVIFRITAISNKITDYWHGYGVLYGFNFALLFLHSATRKLISVSHRARLP